MEARAVKAQLGERGCTHQEVDQSGTGYHRGAQALTAYHTDVSHMIVRNCHPLRITQRFVIHIREPERERQERLHAAGKKE